MHAQPMCQFIESCWQDLNCRVWGSATVADRQQVSMLAQMMSDALQGDYVWQVIKTLEDEDVNVELA